MDAEVARRLAGGAGLFSQADGFLFALLSVQLPLMHDDTSFQREIFTYGVQLPGSIPVPPCVP